MRPRLLGFIIGVILLDQTAKAVAPSLGFPGISGNLYHPLLALIVTLGALWGLTKHPSVALSLIIGGGLSNLADTVLRGQVIDIFVVKNLAFNLADVSIIGGVAATVFAMKLYTRDMKKPLHQEHIRKIVTKIAHDFQPAKIIVFGSYAWGNPDPESDVDVCVVKESPDSRLLARAIDDALSPRSIPLDIIAYTPEELRRQVQEERNLFLEDIVQHGKVVYEADKVRV